jgi:DNA-binding transcriptional LysR family regulator
MDTLLNLRAFLAVAGAGSFSAAARQTGVATSVIAKRIDQLEWATGTRLFQRTTRSMQLSEVGQNWIRRVQSLVADLDDVMAGVARTDQELGGPLRVKAPTTMTILYLADMLAQFQRLHPKIVLDVILTDRVVNPVDEGFDVVVAAFGTSFSGVVDQPLCPLRRVLCASPDYLERRGVPKHPRELSEHHTLSFQPTGNVWSFSSSQGPIQVEVSPKVSASDGQVLLAGARAGNGMAILSEYVALPSLRRNELVAVLEDFPVPEIWLKALAPDTRYRMGRVHALIEFLKDSFAPPLPWERDIA